MSGCDWLNAVTWSHRPGTQDQNSMTTGLPVGPAPHGVGDGDGAGEGDSCATCCGRTAALGGAAPIRSPAATRAAAAVTTSPWLVPRCEIGTCMCGPPALDSARPSGTIPLAN